MFSELMKDAESVPQTIEYKLKKGIATLEDQEEVLELNDPWTAFLFALKVPGAHLEKCQEIACKSSWYAYEFATDVPEADIEKCQEAASKDPWIAYLFAKYVPGADKEYCRKACVGTKYYDFL